MSLMGIYIGTTGCKAVCFSPEGLELSVATREYPLITPQPGWIELDPVFVWRMTVEAVREAAAKASGDPVEALSVSSQGEAFMPVARDGRVLGNAIVTFDSRATAIAEGWQMRLSKQRIMTITGMPLSGIHTLNKIIWWKRERPDVYEETWKFLCFEDFCFFQMGLPPIIDYSLAARTMAFDVVQLTWSEELLDIAGVDVSLLPEPRPSGWLVGELSEAAAAELGLPVGCKVVAGGHDQACGALGAGVTRERVAMSASDTVECIAPVLSELVLNDEMLRNYYACYPHVVSDMYVTLAFNFTGASLLRWYRDTLGGAERVQAAATGQDVYDLIIDSAADEPTSLYVLPYFTTAGTPYMDTTAKGAIVGLQFGTTRAQILRALLEGITYEMKLNVERLADAGVPIDEFRAVGPGTRSDRWMQLKADMLNRPVAVMNVSEATCLGAAILAGVSIGRYRDCAEAVENVVKVRRVFEPDPKRAKIYEQKFRTYEQLYPTLKGLMHRM